MKEPDFAKMIKDFRKDCGMTQGELALACGVARTSILNYESGKVPPPARVVWLIESNFIKKCSKCSGKGFIINPTN